ncbi:MAG: PhzF family phenazine biosynthesis protein [Candidatus Eremiobacteraeota bacterium]|nr:PhzF family phenazine biosynthesis protein [Candidatus Eremiobacteraeota bacterium]
MTRRYRYDLLDVFTKTRFQGNPLAVFPSGIGMSEAEMQRIAGELNLSETVFLVQPTLTSATVKARIFTPRRELDFAGHPTIGVAYVVALRESPADAFAIEENVGLVPIECDHDEAGDRRFWLTTPELAFYETLDPALCARLLGLAENEIAGSPQFVSAGSPLLFICVNSMEAVDRAVLRQQYLAGALGSAGSVGTFVFARKEPDSPTRLDTYSRMFAPQTGIREDPATGGAMGPLAGYMMQHGLLPADGAGVRFTNEQGVAMGRPSVLHVRLEPTADGVAVKVGGSAVMTGAGAIFLD